jgi:M6 family metalloprotease-like protein
VYYLNSYEGKCCEDGFIGGHSEKWAEAILKADADFDYSIYDKNRDGVLQPTELGILIVVPQNNPFGTNRPVVARNCPNDQSLFVDGVRIDVMAEAYIGDPPNLALVAHELSHFLHGTPDMYFRGFFPYAAGSFSLMDQSHDGNPHLDPYNKFRLGWINPKVVTQDGCYELNDVETSGDVLLLYDPQHSNDEFFLIENRQKDDYYDSWLPDYGLGVWHIIEDKNIYSKLSAPYGVSDDTWSIVGSNEWGRRGIRMIRPTYGPPSNNYRALWDSSENDIYLNWYDGTSSGFSIKKISNSGNKMKFVIDTPN